ncbi:MAG: sigma-70 family RNA polymerase sigma factor [Deltaproteobacteria bacterium]|nr:sigma-70 family RNA polymerase sigma factor [Deltaproteobacteria bacterium]
MDLSTPEADDRGAIVRRGAPLDFQTLFRAECSYVFHSLRRLGVQERDLEDVAHEVFLAIHKRLDDYDPARPLKPWIFAFAYRFASDYRRLARHRREQIRDQTDDELEPIDVAPGVEERIDAERSRRLVLDALDALDLDKRAVFVMHEIDGAPIPAVAEALSIPLNTAYSRLRLAREQFAVQVKRLRLRSESDARARRNREMP